MRLKTLVFLAFLAGCCAVLFLLKEDSNDYKLPSSKLIEHPLNGTPEVQGQSVKGNTPIHFSSYIINFDEFLPDDFHLDWKDRAKIIGQKLPQLKINEEFFHPNPGAPYFPFATPSNNFTQSIGGGGNGSGYFLGSGSQQYSGFFGLVIPTPGQLSSGGTSSQPTVTQPPPTAPGNPGGPILGEPPPVVRVPDIETYFTLATLLILSYILRTKCVRMGEERS